MARLENNLSEGNVAKQLVRFSLPFLLSNLIQTLYNVADMFIVARFSDLKSISMAGVSNGSQMTIAVTNAVIGLALGGTILVGQYLGMGKRKDIKETIGTLLTLLMSLSVVITVVMLLLSDSLLGFINTPAGQVYDEAKSYFVITMLGTVFIFGYNALSAIMRGMGDSKSPMIFVGVSCVVNIGLDFLLVSAFHMGASGAALATVISQALSVVLCIIYLKKNNFVFDFGLKSFGFNKEKLKLIVKLGLPTCLNNIAVSTSFLFMMRMINSLDTVGSGVYSAAVGVVGKFNGFAILPAIAMSSAISAMVAQNIGAGRIDRAKKTMFIGMGIATAISWSIFALAQCFPEAIASIFADGSDANASELIAVSVDYMRSFSFDYVFVPIQFCFNGLFIGSGHTRFSLINGIASSIAFRIPAAWLFGIFLEGGMRGMGLGAPIATVAALVIATCFYFSGVWKKRVISSATGE